MLPQTKSELPNHQRSIAAATERVQFEGLTCSPLQKEAIVREVLDSIAWAGFTICRHQTLELEVAGQIRGCLRVAHHAVHAGDTELACQKIEASIATIQLLDDYLRELQRLGTTVPLTWRDFVQGRYAEKHLQCRDVLDSMDVCNGKA